MQTAENRRAESKTEERKTVENGKKFRKADILLLGGMLAAGLLIGAVILITGRKGASVTVSVCGEITAEYPLSEPLTVTIEGKDGGTNDLVIEDGEAYLTDASCPDRLCVNMGRISLDGESIVCLPNQVVVTVVDEDHENGENDLDAVVGGN